MDVRDRGAGADLTLTYDQSLLTATNVANSSFTNSFSVQSNITPGQVRISMANARGISGTGALVNVTFSVASGVQGGQKCILTLAGHTLYNEMSQSIIHDVDHGEFMVG